MRRSSRGLSVDPRFGRLGTMQRQFNQIDVFASKPYEGNPVAVVLDGSGLTTNQMQSFARWTNLSETTFILPPSDPRADYRLRIFTSFAELPFAGHPTLGSCHAWLAAGGTSREDGAAVQECGAGLITVRRMVDGLAFAAPPLMRRGPVDEELVQHIASVLCIDRAAVLDAAWADNGPGWVAVMLESADTVLALQPGFVDLALGVVGPYPKGSPEAERLTCPVAAGNRPYPRPLCREPGDRVRPQGTCPDHMRSRRDDLGRRPHAHLHQWRG